MNDAMGLVSTLNDRGVILSIRDSRVEFDGPMGSITESDIAWMRTHKPAVIDAIRRSCTPHNDPTNYVEEPAPDRSGWIRTTCLRCGHFVGFRPAGVER